MFACAAARRAIGTLNGEQESGLTRQFRQAGPTQIYASNWAINMVYEPYFQ